MSAGGWLASSRVAGMPCMCHILTPHTAYLHMIPYFYLGTLASCDMGKENFSPRELDGADAFEVEYKL